jgi:hypothetical protein
MKDLAASHYNVQRHDTNKTHMKKVSAIKSVPTIEQCTTEKSSHHEKLRKIELRLCMFLIENNISINVADPLMKLFKENYLLLHPNETDTLKGLSLGRTKATAIIQKIIKVHNEHDIFGRMKKDHFSIIMDESTDITTMGQLAITVRLLDGLQPKDEFLTVIEIKDATGKGLYEDLCEFFSSRDIPYKENMVGFGSDNASVMVGIRDSVTSRLRKDIPTLTFVRCTCHSLQLCAVAAGKKLPSELMDMLICIFYFFKKSGKRNRTLREVQKLLDIKVLKVLKPSDTRWLSLNDTVQRILQILPALRKYFQDELTPLNNAFKLSLEKAHSKKELEYICDLLKNPLTEMYLSFLAYILPIICTFNLQFQSEAPQIFNLYDKMHGVCSLICKNYLQEEYVNTNIKKASFDFQNVSQFRQVFAGGLVNAFLERNQTVSSKLKDEFFNNVRNYYITLVAEIRSRFDKNDKIFEYSSHMKPSNLKSLQTLSSLAVHTKLNLDILELDRELQFLKEENVNFNKDFLNFYEEISQIKKGDGTLAYENIIRLVKYILVIPHSSATVERIFSAINLNKTKTRGRLENETLSALRHGKSILKRMSQTCYNFQPPKSMFSLFSTGEYKNALGGANK